MSRKRFYSSNKEAHRIRTDACTLCVFFESYIADGPAAVGKHMGIGKEPKPVKAPVIQLITRD